MPHEVTVSSASQVAPVLKSVPTIFAEAGQGAAWRFLEFFTANIRNPNTREAYARAVAQFALWCDERKLHLPQLNPFIIAGYVEELGKRQSVPTVKQHLAAIRMLFDWLVVGQVLPMNPASSVRGPKHSVKRGKTPVLSPDEARTLFDSIDVSTIGGLRDRALIGVMVFSFSRVSAVTGMNVEDFFEQGRRFWFRLHEKGGKMHDLPAHHKADEYVHSYIDAAGIAGQKATPLFRTLDRRRQLTNDRMERREVLAMVKRRSLEAGIPATTCCHSFRATGITAFLLAGGSIERAAVIANHESTRTTQLYNRTSDAVTLDEIERIII